MQSLWAVSVLTLGITMFAAGQVQGQAGVFSLRVDLPDGANWKLGEGGIGRPFKARLLLTNASNKPLTIWDYQNSEGAQCPGVILTDAKGKETLLQPPPFPRLAGVPTVITLAPSQVLAIELELLRLIGERGLPPGTYKLKGVYDNNLKNDGTFIKAAVWVGRLETEEVKITIVAPK